MQKRKPTYEQRKLLSKAGYDTHVWFILRETPDGLEIINKDSNERALIKKQ